MPLNVLTGFMFLCFVMQPLAASNRPDFPDNLENKIPEKNLYAASGSDGELKDILYTSLGNASRVAQAFGPLGALGVMAGKSPFFLRASLGLNIIVLTPYYLYGARDPYINKTALQTAQGAFFSTVALRGLRSDFFVNNMLGSFIHRDDSLLNYYTKKYDGIVGYQRIQRFFKGANLGCNAMPGIFCVAILNKGINDFFEYIYYY